jgi:hypothetical protein
LVASFFAFMLVEMLWPARRAMPVVPHWRLVGIAGFAVTMLIFGVTPLFVLPLLGSLHLLDLSGWGG